MGASVSNSVSVANCAWNFYKVERNSSESGMGKQRPNLQTFRRICACAYRMSPVVGAEAMVHRLWLVR